MTNVELIKNWLKENEYKKCTMHICVYELDIYFNYSEGYVVIDRSELDEEDIYLLDPTGRIEEYHLITDDSELEFTTNKDEMTFTGDAEILTEHFTISITIEEN